MNFKLATANLLISQFFILIFLVFANYFWFPDSLSEFIDFNQNAKIITIVNLVLGPLLILFIAKKNKNNLNFDLSILLTIQLLAIFYGAYTIYQKHPSYAVFAIDRFTLVNNKDSEQEKIRFKELKTSFFSKTKLAYARFPNNLTQKNELILSAMTNPEKDLDKRHEYFEPYSHHINSVIKKSIDSQKLFSTHNARIKLNTFLKKFNGLEEDYLYLPLQSASKDVVWVLHKETAQPIGILDIDPWLE